MARGVGAIPFSKNVSALFSNIRSILRHRDELCSVIDSCSADVVALTETWLSSNVRNCELFSCDKRFNVYRCDRGARNGGGVLLAVADHIDSFCVRLNSDLEIVCCCLCLNFQKVILAVCYRPPSANPSFVSNLHDVLNSIIVRFPSSPILLLGDFNYPQIKWSHPHIFSNPFSSDAEDFIKLCDDFSFSQLVSLPTRITATTANVLDLILSTSPELISSVTFMPALSDHSLLHFSLDVPAKTAQRTLKKIRDYGRGDYDSINGALGLFLNDYLDHFSDRSLELNWTLFKTQVELLTNKHIPLRNIPIVSNSPWFNNTLKRLSNKKKRKFRAAKLTNSEVKWLEYHEAANAYKSAIADAKSVYFSITLPSLLTNNVKQFWKAINGNKNTTLSLFTLSGEPVSTDDCANVFNSTFVESFSNCISSTLPQLQQRAFLPMYPILIQTSGIIKIIEQLKISCSAGVDGINSKFLLRTKEYSSIILSKLFEQSLTLGCLPDDWKVGKVVPVHKTGDHHSPLNYRPISITSIPCKILEHIIFSHLVQHLESNSFFAPAQHGFRKSFSCETQLLTFTHDLHLILDHGSQVDCIFLDFAKAFDKVSHNLLLHKLSKLNIDQDVLSWIRAFLNNRSQFVSVNNTSSSPAPVTSGVPQGSVLGPLLFLIFINDLPSCVSSSISLFADDCVLYREITNTSDVAILQSDLDCVSNWCNKWNMQLNTNKCKVMTVSRLNSHSTFYYLNSVLLEGVSSYKYLGIHISSNLSWEPHIRYITNNANRMLGFLKRNFPSVPVSLKLLLYKTLVRSKLEYASPIWDPGTDLLTTAVEAIQNRSVRFILTNYHRSASVTSMKTFLNLPNLSSRRELSRLCLFHKIYHHNSSLHQKLLTPPSYVSPRVDHQHKIGLPVCKTTTFYNSFIPKTTITWNHLPSSVVSVTDATMFKRCLTTFLS